MTTGSRRSLDEYLNRQYGFVVLADEEGGFVIHFPDLPGCITQVEDISEISSMAEDIRVLWIETAYEHGIPIPEPTYPPTYSGKFNVRLPRSLHRKLAESAEADGVSLNQHVVAILSAGVSDNGISSRLDRIETLLETAISTPRNHVSENRADQPEMDRVTITLKALGDVGEILQESGLTLDELIESGREIRGEIIQETYSIDVTEERD